MRPHAGWDEIHGNIPLPGEWGGHGPGEDYRAIQWLQDQVEGSPVILEAQAYEYYWGNRYNHLHWTSGSGLAGTPSAPTAGFDRLG
jgi:hypothetical protein